MVSNSIVLLAFSYLPPHVEFEALAGFWSMTNIHTKKMKTPKMVEFSFPPPWCRDQEENGGKWNMTTPLICANPSTVGANKKSAIVRPL